MKQQDDKLLFSVKSAAEALDCSRGTIYGLMKSGRVRVVKIGADSRIPLDEIQRLAKDGCETGRAA